jgi:hypothetical protein
MDSSMINVIKQSIPEVRNWNETAIKKALIAGTTLNIAVNFAKDKDFDDVIVFTDLSYRGRQSTLQVTSSTKTKTVN